MFFRAITSECGRRRLAAAGAAATLAMATVAAGAMLTAPAAAGAAQPSGAALSWGSNTNGQLGIGTTCSGPGSPDCLSVSPVPVLGPGQARTLSPMQTVPAAPITAWC
jgi:hypothetical protein